MDLKTGVTVKYPNYRSGSLDMTGYFHSKISGSLDIAGYFHSEISKLPDISQCKLHIMRDKSSLTARSISLS